MNLCLSLLRKRTQRNATAESAINRLVNAIIVQALKEKATEIHLEPSDKLVQVRYLIENQLHDVLQPRKLFHEPMCYAIRIMAGLKIRDEQNLQQGLIKYAVGGKLVEIQLKTMPTHNGELIVMKFI